MNKEKDNPQQQMQDLFSQMVSQTSGMFSPMDPLGAMKPLQQVAEAWTKNPQQFADAMQDWTQQIGDMNTRIWQDFLDRQKENDSKENQSAELADLPYFTWIREYYKTYTNWMEQQIRDTSGVSEKIKEDASFWSKQMLSALSPNNYFWTNPEAINAFIESKGETLRHGLQNWLNDQMRDGLPEMVDKSQFQVGGNLANTPGKVIFRNELIELIQYEPMTKEVHEIPIVITPPWINKFYILDLKPKKSFVLNLVSQGYTVFVISWKNPTKEMRNTSMDDYLSLGPLKAIEVAKAITKSKQVHAVGYCIGGTLLASAMASLNHPDNPQNGNVKDWTLLTTLVEFERPGELGSFITEESLEYLEEQMSKQGSLEGPQMGNTMGMLRPDELELGGYPIDLGRITQPLYCVSAEEDHITPWTQVFRINALVKGKVRFVLSTSGHIAAVVNPPVDPPKRSFWASDSNQSQEPEAWKAGIEKKDGTWWPDWTNWLDERCGKMIAPPTMGSKKYKPLADAPGTYVMES